MGDYTDRNVNQSLVRIKFDVPSWSSHLNNKEKYFINHAVEERKKKETFFGASINHAIQSNQTALKYRPFDISWFMLQPIKIYDYQLW